MASGYWVFSVESRFVVCFADNTRLGCKAGRAGNRAYRTNALLRRWLVSHASVFQHIGPFSAGTCMAVLQVLSEMVCAEKLLGLVAFSKFVHVIQMFGSRFPIRRVGKFFTAIPTDVCGSRASGRGVESCVNTSERCT